MRSLIWLAFALAACDGGSFRTGGGSGRSPRLALANGYAYWFDGIGALVRAPLSQPRASALVALASGADGNIHVNSQYAYWRENAEIRRIALDGFSEPVVIGASTAGVPANLALDEDNLYYPRATSVVRQSVATGAESIILSDRAANSLALDGETLVGTSCKEGIDATWRVSIDGGIATRITEHGCGELVAVDNSFAYTFDLVNQRPAIVRVNARGGTPVVLYETASNVFAVSEGFIYTVSLDDEIVRVPASGGEATVLALGAAAGIAIDGTSLYWIDRIGFSPDLVLQVSELPQ